MKKLFFLRGLIRESGHWSGFLERFGRAFPGAEAVPLEIPGNGQGFREASPLSVPAMTDSAREQFLTHRSGDDYLFALSLGGMMGLDWLVRYPQDFKGAVLVNTSVRGLSPLHHRLRPRNYTRVLRMLLSGDNAFLEENILEMTSARPRDHEAALRSWIAIAEERPVSPSNALRQLWAAARFKPPRQKPSVPILLLNGARDQLVNPRCSLALAEAWGLPLEVNPTAGHDLTLDDPAWVIERLRAYF